MSDCIGAGRKIHDVDIKNKHNGSTGILKRNGRRCVVGEEDGGVRKILLFVPTFPLGFKHEIFLVSVSNSNSNHFNFLRHMTYVTVSVIY